MTYVRMDIETSEQGEIPSVQYFRVPHDKELRNANTQADLNSTDRVYRGDGNQDGEVRERVRDSGQTLPEVYRLLPDQTTALSCNLIKLWRDLNPFLSLETFGTILGNSFAFTNNTGWPGRRNCLTNKDMTAQDPTFHAPLICGGAVLKGSAMGDRLFIQNLSNREVVPPASYVMARPWLWFYAVQVAPSGNITYINKMGTDGRLHPVIVPFVTAQPVWLPLAWLDKLPSGFIPPSPMWLPSV